jgi:hypothetical protein
MVAWIHATRPLQFFFLGRSMAKILRRITGPNELRFRAACVLMSSTGPMPTGFFPPSENARLH